MQTPKVRRSSSEAAPLKVSPRPKVIRQLKTTPDSDSPTSSNQTGRVARKERIPAVVSERRSPRGPVTELPKKSPSKVSQLESQVAQLQSNLSEAKEQLSSSETLKQQALQDAEEFRKQVSALTLELDESKKKFEEISGLEKAQAVDAQKISEEKEKEWEARFNALQNHHSADFAALGSAMDEIHRLKSQLEIAARAAPGETKNSEEVVVAHTKSLEEQLEETFSLVEDMKKQLKECQDSEAHARASASETLLQLETARTAVEALQLEGVKSAEAYNALASELEESKGQIKSLEELVGKLKADLRENSSGENGKVDDEMKTFKEQIESLKSEVELLRTAQETAVVERHEEQISSAVQLHSAAELVEQVKSESTRKEADLEAELSAVKSQVAELTASLMDKETELQCVIEENEALNSKMGTATSGQKEFQMEKELKELTEAVADLKANLMDKETEFQNILEENETLKLELKKKETDLGKANRSTLSELDAARTAEREAVAKLESFKDEAERSGKRASRVAEQLGAAQAANVEMEAELRKIKVQSDQWRKAAEVAASMLSDGSLAERNGSVEGKFSPLNNRANGSPGDSDEDALKKRNGNVLKKFGLSWKKNHK
uniref:Interactor of constitutive active ROPs 3 n=1 Tax=Kalanchoe fedtschenkoi TaxID=63787 RepID=A0A7N0ULQ4_KALFE